MTGTHAEMLNEAEFTLVKALRALSYGALEITVHDARIVSNRENGEDKIFRRPEGLAGCRL